MNTEEPCRNVIVISDTHFGCRMALCPPGEIQLDEGKYVHSRLQAKIWAHWRDFWDSWVPTVTKGEPYVLVHNGDMIDGVHHGVVTPISHNLTDQGTVATLVMQEVLANPKCVRYYQIRGTEAHGGKSGQVEEALAKSLKAIPDEDGHHARWELWLRLNTSLIHFTHHIGITSAATYEMTAIHKELVEAYAEAGRWRESPPDCIVRSHRHRGGEVRIPTEEGYGISFCTPAWQLKTPLAYRFALGRVGNVQLGGCLIRHGDEDSLYTRFKVWKIGRPAEEVV